MNDETPPKRITRSKATAKTNTAEPEVKIATAAGKAKATRNKVPAVSKRKTRADDGVEETNITEQADNKDGMEETAAPPRAPRGRRKAVQTEAEFEAEAVNHEEPSKPAEVPARATRGRPKKLLEELPQEEPPKPARSRQQKVSVKENVPKEVLKEETVPIEPVKITRGRPRKAAVSEAHQVEAEPVPEPVKRTRGRAPTVSKVVTAPKKTVKFEEPQEQDKENLIPDVVLKGKGKDTEGATGMRARPVRKPAVSTRATRGRPKAASSEQKQPLSPKKPTQVATTKENFSEDELATMEKTPMKPLTKSPRKELGSVFGTAKKLDFTTSIIANRAMTQDLGASLMGSPARRPPPSPYKDSLKTSPKRANLGDSMARSPFKSSMQPPRSIESPFKTSLLQSPAKRPQSPVKITSMGSPSRNNTMMSMTPRFGVSRFNTTPRILTNSVIPNRSLVGSPSKQGTEDMGSIDSKMTGMSVKPFPGRLSSILPRAADPSIQDSLDAIQETQTVLPAQDTVPEDDKSSIDPIQLVCDPMEVDTIQTITATEAENVRSTTPQDSPPRYSIGNFSLRDEDPFQDSDSEDELASGSHNYSPAPLNGFGVAAIDFASSSTPTPQVVVPNTPVTDRQDQVGFTPLSHQLKDWMPPTAINEQLRTFIDEHSTEGLKTPAFDQEYQHTDVAITQPSPAKSSFFEDAINASNILVESCASIDKSDNAYTGQNDGIDAMEFAPTTLDEEDLALAAEADEMSLIAVEETEDVEEAVDLLNQSIRGDTKALSEASQEYGDENAVPVQENIVPIDPTLLAHDLQYHPPAFENAKMVEIVTPIRTFGERQIVFHTVSKVPLKPAAADSPLKVSKRSASVARMPLQRPAPPPPSLKGLKAPLFEQPAATTPTGLNNWSTATTPVRTPRRDLNDQVLKGAVVFVDVHTTEGADASAVFVELLGQMGAKCVKSWNWNPSTSGNPETDEGMKDVMGGKVGITHVVFKDGGKRTLEKVRESQGVVLCVGVGWVLDCERQKSWLSEASYAIDTALIPRGGHRRRKSMEPRSIQTLNGRLSLAPHSTPRSVSASHAMVSPTKEFLNLPDTPGSTLKSNRRKSTLWVRSPPTDIASTSDEAGLMLSPVPATPAPEVISAYAEHILDDGTPDGAATPYFLRKEELVQRTCPPKDMHNAASHDLPGNGEANGGGVLMQRLLLARRKSLQWAPKVGSPLAKGGFGT